MQLTALYVSPQATSPRLSLLSTASQPTVSPQLSPTSSTLQPHISQRSGHALRLFFAGFGQDAKLWQQFLAPLVTAAQNASVEPDRAMPDVYMLSNYGQGVQGEHTLPQIQDSLASTASIAPTASTGELEVATIVDLTQLQALIASYEQIEVVAWSFGVRAALAILGNLDLSGIKLTRAIALCGTTEAVDAMYGIAPAVYQHMCRGLSNKRLGAKVMQNFARQMLGTKDTSSEANTANDSNDCNGCNGSRAKALSISDSSETQCVWSVPTDETVLQAYIEHYAYASQAELCAELYVMPHLKVPEIEPFVYQQVFVAQRDAIFSLNASRLSWQAYSAQHEIDKVDYREIDSGHLPLQLMGELLFAARS